MMAHLTMKILFLKLLSQTKILGRHLLDKGATTYISSSCTMKMKRK